jgi:hypothetical protein
MTDMTNAPLLDPLPVRPAATRRPRLWRSVVAFLVSVSLLLAMTGVAVFAQTGAAGGPRFVPATAVAYGEVRLDLPGDQHDQLAAFMANFPGFADPSSFDTKLNELLDQALSSATGGGTTWSGNIQTWSNGQVGLGLLALPTTAGAQPDVVIGLGLKDRAALETQLTTMLGTQTATTEDYAGTTVTTAGTTSYALTDAYLLVSPAAADVKTALDVLAGTTPSLATDPGYQAARATQPADDLGSFYIATASLQPFIEQWLSQQSGAGMLAGQVTNLPAWIGGYAQVAGDHLAIGASAQLAVGTAPSVGETDLAAHFPADTLLYVETRDLGKTVDSLLAQLKTQLAADPKNTDTITGVEQGLGVTLDKALDFVQDGAVGVGFDGQRLSAGIVATLSDQAGGGRRIQTLLGLLRLVGGGANAPFAISSTVVNGTTVTTITLQPSAGIPANLPFDPSVSIAVADGHLYLGLGDFAATALAQDPAASLATDPRYSSAVTAAGTPNAGVVWLDLAAAAPFLVQVAGANDASYQTNIKPWVDALDTFVLTATTDSDIVSLKALLFVK